MNDIPQGLELDKGVIFGQRPTHPGLFEIKFHNPKKYNALKIETQEKFAELVYKANLDPTVKCVLVYGSAKFFSSGNDISIFHDTKNIMANAKRGTLEATYHFIGSVMNS